MKKSIAIISLAITLTLAGCGEAGTDGSLPVPTQQNHAEKIKIAASFYPLAEFARQVGGNNVEVFTVTPPGAEPHEYEPTPKDITEMNEADLLILNGGGMDEWGERIKAELEQKGVRVIDMSERIEFKKSGNSEEDSHHEDGHDHGGMDPHIWLNPVLAQTEVDLIKDALVKIRPEQEESFNLSALEFKKELAALDEEMRTGLKNCRIRDFVTSHQAFGYLAERYGLNQIAVAGLSTDEEPSAKRIAEIGDLAKGKAIRYIFFETLISPKLSETIANEIGAQTLVLNPIEGLTPDDMSAGKNYGTLMRENLNNLRTALECE